MPLITVSLPRKLPRIRKNNLHYILNQAIHLTKRTKRSTYLSNQRQISPTVYGDHTHTLTQTTTNQLPNTSYSKLKNKKSSDLTKQSSN